MSAETEQYVIGSILQEPNAWLDVSAILTPEHFQSNSCRTVYEAFSSIQEDGIEVDLTTVRRYLEESGQLARIGGLEVMRLWIESTPSVENVIAYAHATRRDTLLIKINRSAQQLREMSEAPSNRNEDELIAHAYSIVQQLESDDKRNNSIKLASEALVPIYDELERMLLAKPGDMLGISSGFSYLDYLTSGFQPGQLIVLAGRPGSGKTAMAVSMTVSALLQQPDLHALYFSLEMSTAEMTKRFLSIVGEVPYSDMKPGKMNKDSFAGLLSKQDQLNAMFNRLHVADSAQLSPVNLRLLSRRLKQQLRSNLGLIVVDYLQLMNADGVSESRVAAITQISGALKQLARELDVPLLALAQLSRQAERGRDDEVESKVTSSTKPPRMAHLRDSGSIEQDADIILFPERVVDSATASSFNPLVAPTVDSKQDKSMEKARITMAKHRNGPTGTIQCRFDTNLMKFVDVPDRDRKNRRQEQPQASQQYYQPGTSSGTSSSEPVDF